MPKLIDLTGKVFSRLTVIELAGRKDKQGVRWLCKCECGKEFISRSGDILNGHTRSCGCLKTDMIRERRTTHGMKGHHLYGVWQDMKKRCRNEKNVAYANYGGRGISICSEWEDPGVFLKWALKNYSEGLVLDRRDNDKGYSEDNCRFVSRSISNCNKRISKTNKVGYIGVCSWGSGRFMVTVMSEESPCYGKRLYLGTFNTAKEAAAVRNEFILKHKLNNKLQDI